MPQCCMVCPCDGTCQKHLVHSCHMEYAICLESWALSCTRAKKRTSNSQWALGGRTELERICLPLHMYDRGKKRKSCRSFLYALKHFRCACIHLSVCLLFLFVYLFWSDPITDILQFAPLGTGINQCYWKKSQKEAPHCYQLKQSKF